MDEKISHWKTVIQEWRDSGQTQKEYCHERGFKRSTLHYWMRRIKKAEDDGVAIQGLVRIPSPKAQRTNQIIIEIDSRYRIIIPEGFTVEYLRELLAAFG